MGIFVKTNSCSCFNVFQLIYVPRTFHWLKFCAYVYCADSIYVSRDGQNFINYGILLSKVIRVQSMTDRTTSYDWPYD